MERGYWILCLYSYTLSCVGHTYLECCGGTFLFVFWVGGHSQWCSRIIPSSMWAQGSIWDAGDRTW